MKNALPAVIEAGATKNTTGRERIGDRQVVEMWAARSSSLNTRRNYLRQAARLLAFLEARGLDLAAAHVGDIQEYLAGIKGAPATRANATASIKSLLSFAQETGYLRLNVGKVVKAPPIKNTLAERILSEADVMRMIVLETNPRNRALLTVLYGAGLRISEACDLRWRD